MQNLELKMPSGIKGLDLHSGDHILFINLSEPKASLERIVDFLIAGLENKTTKEIATIELSDRLSKEDVEILLKPTLSNKEIDNLDIAEARRNYSYYKDNKFTVNGMREAISQQSERLTQEVEGIRIASADSGRYINWLKNPLDYLEYESILVGDLRERLKRNVLQLCAYDLNSLLNQEKEKHIPAAYSIIKLIQAHNKVITLTESRDLLLNHDAIGYLLKTFTISPKLFTPPSIKKTKKLKSLLLTANFLIISIGVVTFFGMSLIFSSLGMKPIFSFYISLTGLVGGAMCLSITAIDILSTIKEK